MEDTNEEKKIKNWKILIRKKREIESKLNIK